MLTSSAAYLMTAVNGAFSGTFILRVAVPGKTSDTWRGASRLAGACACESRQRRTRGTEAWGPTLA